MLKKGVYMNKKDVDRMIETMSWLFNDSPSMKKYLEVNGETLINDFAKPKKPHKDSICMKYGIRRVIINKPAIIILWKDNTKTIAKCEDGEKFDAEKGFAIAVAKHFVGNTNFREMLDTFIWDKEDK